MSVIETWREVEGTESTMSSYERKSNEWLRTSRGYTIGGWFVPMGTELIVWKYSNATPRTLCTFFLGTYLVSVLSDGEVVRKNTPRMAGTHGRRPEGRTRPAWNARSLSGSR